MTGILSLLQFILSIAFLIIIHELGHFIASRLVGIEVEEFGIGYPPRIAKLFTFRGTEYTLNWIPFGGFVRIKGEHDPDVEKGMASSNPWKRIFIMLAGPFMNLSMALLVFALIFYQLGDNTIVVREIAPDSPAEAIGLLPDDRIISLDGEEIHSMDAIHQVIGSNLDTEIEFVVERNSEEVSMFVTPRSNPPEGQGAVGFIMEYLPSTTPIDPFTAIARGAELSVQQIKAILSLPGQIIKGTIDPEQGRLIGYKGMLDIYNLMQDADEEIASSAPEAPKGINTLGFLGTISLSLGLLNLMPIPALDGGRILFTLPEILFKKRIPQKYENAVNAITFLVLIALMLYVNIQDFVNPLDLPSPR